MRKKVYKVVKMQSDFIPICQRFVVTLLSQSVDPCDKIMYKANLWPSYNKTMGQLLQREHTRWRTHQIPHLPKTLFYIHNKMLSSLPG